MDIVPYAVRVEAVPAIVKGEEKAIPPGSIVAVFVHDTLLIDIVAVLVLIKSKVGQDRALNEYGVATDLLILMIPLQDIGRLIL